MTEKLWVAEYSPSQGRFHKQEVTRACETNYQALMSGYHSDWYPFFVGSLKECGDVINRVRHRGKQIKREATCSKQSQ